jgi:DNA polymerase-3 subunit delta
MIYFIYGEDLFRIKEEVAAVKEAARRAGVEITQLEAKDLTLEAFRENLTLGSLFSGKRVILIGNLFSLASTELKDKMPTLFRELPSGITLVLWEEGWPDRKSHLFALMGKIAKCLKKPFLKNQELIGWVKSRAAAKNMKLTSEAAVALARIVGNDLGRMDSELEKLRLWAQGRSIAAQDVFKLTEDNLPPSVFSFLDALGKEGQAGLAAERLLSSGEEPLYLLSMIAYQVRNLLLISNLMERKPHLSAAVISSELGLHPYTAQKTLQQARLFNPALLVALHRKITDLDLAIKTGGIEASDALILLSVYSHPIN